MNVEWEKHDSEDFPPGNVHTVSILPRVELLKILKRRIPYVFAGAGLNINWVDENTFLDLSNNNRPRQHLCFKVGTGLDFFLFQDGHSIPI
jgi:hypothetical protein